MATPPKSSHAHFMTTSAAGPVAYTDAAVRRRKAVQARSRGLFVHCSCTTLNAWAPDTKTADAMKRSHALQHAFGVSV